MQYDVWSIPTPKGRKSFNWAPRKLNESPLNKDSADELRYLSSIDARTPDQDDYIRYVIRPVALTDEDVRLLEAVPVEAYISRERFEELESVARAGYPTAALMAAIREAIYALNKQIVIPPTSRK